MLKTKKTSILLMVFALLFCLLAAGAVSAADPPMANFTSNVTNGTGPLSVQFNDTSTGNITSWNWDFSDNGTSTEQNPIHNYTQTGTYNVTLTVNGTDGNNTLLMSNYISVYSPYINTEEWTFESGTTNGFTAVNTWSNGMVLSISPTAQEGVYSLQCYSLIGIGYANASLENVPDASTYQLDYWIWSSNIGYGFTSTGISVVDASGAIIAGFSGGDSTFTDTDYTAICNRPAATWVHCIVEWNKDTGIINHFIYDSNGTLLGSRQITRAASVGKTPAAIWCNVRGISQAHTIRYDNITFTSGSPGGNISTNFNANTTSGSGPLTVAFTDQSTGSPTTWLWDFGDGTTSTEQNPTHTYTTSGYYTVKLTTNYSNSSSSYFDKKSNYIKVYLAPVSNFTATTAWGTLPSVPAYTHNAVQFTDNSTNVESWYWDFGDGTSSTEQNPTHTYNKGNYTVSLTVTNNMSVNNTSSIPIQVDDTPIMVTTNLTSGTYNTTQTVSLNSNDSNATIYYATDTTDPRTSSTRIIYTGPITLNTTTTLRYAAAASAGYWTPLYMQNYVIGNGTTNAQWIEFQNNNQHTGQSSYVGAQTNIVIWTYTTGGTIYYASPVIGADGILYIGSYDGKLYALNPDGTLKWNYTTGGYIYSSATIGSDGTVYVGSYDSKLYALNPDGTLQWTYTTGARIYGSSTIGSDGTIYVGSYDKKIYAINPDGTLKWNYTTGNYIYSYGGGPAIGADGTIYVGSYDGKLYALNPDGTLKWTYTTGARIYGSPAIGADGTIYVGSYDKKIYAINPDGTLKWNYTTGNYVYASPGIGADGTIYIGSYDGKLYALNPDGTLKWTYTTGAKIYGSPAIGADGTIYIGSYDQKIYAINPDGTLKWNYTTGNYISASPAIGTDETLYIGSRDNKLYAFKAITPGVSFTATPLTGLVSQTVQFTDTSTYNPTSWLWDFGDETNSTEQNPTHTYNTPGNYIITLTATNAAGSNSTTLSYINISATAIPEPSLTANVTSGLVPVTIQFNGTATFSPTSWLWDFGDGTNSTEQNPTHTYNTAGNFTVSLTATNANGNGTLVMSNFITVTLPSAPVTNFTTNVVSGLVPTTVQFTDSSTGYVISSWLWDFGDNTTSTEQNPTHTYNTPGNYTITLTTTNAGGNNTNVQSNLITISLPSSPVTNFTATTTEGVVPATIQFTDKSTGYVISSWLWDFGDGTNSTEQNPTHTYNTAGNYTVSLTAGNAGGNNTITQTNFITVHQYAVPVASFTVNDTWGINNVTVQFTDTSTGNGISSWFWDFGDGTNSTEQNPIHSYLAVGNYTVSLSVTNPESNSTTTKNGYIVVRDGEPITFSSGFVYVSNDRGVLYDLDGTAFGGPSDTYYLKSSLGTNQLHITGSNNATSGVIYITTTGGRGYNNEIILRLVVDGTISDNFTLNVYTSGYTNLDLATYLVGALNETFTKEDFIYTSGTSHIMLIDLNVGNLNSGTEGGASKIEFTFSNLNNTTTFTAYAWCLSSNQGQGISWTTGGSYTLIQPPVADFTANTTTPTGPVTVQFTDNSTGATSWNWDFNNDRIIDSTLQNPTHTYTTAGTYTVTLTATNSAGNSTKTITDLIKVGNPELVTSNLEIPTNPINGTTYTINTTINNNGESNADAFTVKLYDNNIQVAKINLSGLTAGASTILNFNWTPTTIGNHVLSVIADTNKQINETNRNNNQITQTVNTIASTLPELVTSNLQLPTDPVNGTTYTVNVTVTNTGNGDAGAFTVKLYDNNVQVAKINLSGLTAGASTVLNFNWTPNTIGNHVLSVIADTNKQINETNRNNNQITQNTSIIASTLPDLIVSNLQIPTDPVVGTTYTINVTVANSGASDITSSFAVKLYDNNTQIQKITVNSLAAGASTILTFNWTPTTNGTHNISTIADANKQINEATETNNQITQNVAIA